MYTEEQKHEFFVNALEFIEQIDDSIAKAKAVIALPYEYLSPETWAAIQQENEFLLHALDVLKKSFSLGSKIVDNDALTSHLETVIAAD